VIEGEPPEDDAILLPYIIGEEVAADFLMQGMEEAVEGNEDLWVAIQFVLALSFRFLVSEIRGGNIEKVSKVYVPIWIAKYSTKALDRTLAITGTRKCEYGRVDISLPLRENEEFSELLRN